MRYEDDTAFQRAILANPADTTLKLVYADWLQERADLRAEFVRLQVQLHTMVSSESAVEAAAWFIRMGEQLDPAWVAFMTTLALPFAPLAFQEDEPGHPFSEPVGLRGRVVTFESQYRTADAWDDGLGADLQLFESFDPELQCWYGASDRQVYPFLCALPPGSTPLRASEVLDALKATSFRSNHVGDLNRTAIPYPGYHPGTPNDQIHTDFDQQYIFHHDSPGAIGNGTHGALKRHVADGQVWYVLLHIGRKPCAMVTILAVGRSPHGSRLVGVITSQVCHYLCD
jgi:uncharacterized protein (TIGR02996 family)